MQKEDILKKLKSIRTRWRREQTREQNFRSGKTLGHKPCLESTAKSYGIELGYGLCDRDLSKLISLLEEGEGE